MNIHTVLQLNTSLQALGTWEGQKVKIGSSNGLAQNRCWTSNFLGINWHHVSIGPDSDMAVDKSFSEPGMTQFIDTYIPMPW